MARLKHRLFADIRKGPSVKDLKSSYLKTFGTTARQFNGVRVRLEGKMDSILRLLGQCMETKKRQMVEEREKFGKLV